MFDFNINSKEPYNGTLFRLPLRDKELASISKISSNIPNMKELMPNICNEISSSLLFLKHINTIEWFVWEENDDYMKLVQSVNVTSLDDSIIDRKELKDWGGIISVQIQSRQFVDDYSSQLVSTVEHWMIYNRLNYNQANILIEKMSNPNNPVALLPWGGIACRLDSSIVG